MSCFDSEISTPNCYLDSRMSFDSSNAALLRRYLTCLVLAMWMGGFTFYALIVIPTATKVLGSVRTAGFITQQVTKWLNLIGIVAILFVLWNVVAERKRHTALQRNLLNAAWVTMVLTHVALFATHPFIDCLLNSEARTVHNYDHFENLHNLYLFFATTQWVAVLVFLWLLFLCSRESRAAEPPIPQDHATSGTFERGYRSRNP
jgi:hypothetical protein